MPIISLTASTNSLNITITYAVCTTLCLVSTQQICNTFMSIKCLISIIYNVQWHRLNIKQGLSDANIMKQALHRKFTLAQTSIIILQLYIISIWVYLQLVHLRHSVSQSMGRKIFLMGQTKINKIITRRKIISWLKKKYMYIIKNKFLP